MDRDVSLIIIGAGVAIVSNIVMRLLEYLLRFIAYRLVFVYQERRNRKLLKQKLMGIDADPYKRDYIEELLIDIAKLRGGGGEKNSLDRPVDHVIFVTQWLVTIGAVVFWYIEILPRMK